ncbi:hypothetical protein [Nocardia sp. NPDC051750]|uniref:hypothetical protein n=1 Tax=Nocardia sp. NPDC051750 TaxID=3364325 RepID=UPI0037B9F2F1
MNSIDKAAQEDPEWVVWSSTEHIAEAIDRLFTETLPRVPADWKTLSERVVGPMPQGVDRYSNEMALHWIDDVFDFFFPDEDSLSEPERADAVTQFVAYIGDYFVRHCGGRWVNRPSEAVLFDFGPTIYYDWTGESDNPEDLLFSAVEQGDFMHVTLEWYSRSIDYAEAHGLPHEGRELRRKYGRG